jgi:hypothetical protein
MTFALLTLLAAAPLVPPPMVEADTTVQPVDPRPAHLKYAGVVLDGYHLVETPNWGVLGAGLSIFGASYVPWALIGTMYGSPENLVPIFGPILAYEPASGWGAPGVNALALFFITVDVMAQVAGVTTAFIGLVAKRRWLQRDERPAISFVPSAAGADFGASVIGRF